VCKLWETPDEPGCWHGLSGVFHSLHTRPQARPPVSRVEDRRSSSMRSLWETQTGLTVDTHEPGFSTVSAFGRVCECGNCVQPYVMLALDGLPRVVHSFRAHREAASVRQANRTPAG
jgi:hypothetical protein